MSTVIVPMHLAKSSLSQLVKRAANGETIFIGRYGRAEAALVSAVSVKPKKRLGLLEGMLIVPVTLTTRCLRKFSPLLRGEANEATVYIFTQEL